MECNETTSRIIYRLSIIIASTNIGCINMIKQTIIGFIVTSELDGKYWTEKYTTDNLFEAKVYRTRP